MHAGKNLHGRVARIVADKLLVNLENAFQLLVENLAVNVGQVEVDHWLAVDAEVVLVDDLEDGPCGHVAGNQVPVLRIPLFQEIPALIFRNTLGIAVVALLLRNPDASAFPTRRLRHEPQLVLSRNRRGMDLNEFSIRVIASLLIESGLRRPGADYRIRRLPEDRADAARGHNDGVRRECADLHRAQIHRANAAADPAPVEHSRKEFPVLVLLHLAFGFVAPHLLVESVEKLLPGSGTRECGAVIERSTETAKVE